MRLKHNKKRNTAFVYESLVRELTKAIIKKNKNRQNKVLKLIREDFNKSSVLHEELKLYKVLYESGNLPTARAEKLLAEAKSQYSNLDRKRIFEAQSSLIKKINTTLSKNIYNNFVPNYRSIASIYSIFNVDLSPEEKVLLEEKVVEFMSTPDSPEDVLVPIDNLTYKTFVEKFNQEYTDRLLENQKQLLTSLISSISDNNVEFKVFMNSELGRIKEALTSSLLDVDISSDESLKEKTSKALEKLESFNKRPIDSSMVREVLHYQELVEVIENGG